MNLHSLIKKKSKKNKGINITENNNGIIKLCFKGNTIPFFNSYQIIYTDAKNYNLFSTIINKNKITYFIELIDYSYLIKFNVNSNDLKLTEIQVKDLDDKIILIKIKKILFAIKKNIKRIINSNLIIDSNEIRIYEEKHCYKEKTYHF